MKKYLAIIIIGSMFLLAFGLFYFDYISVDNFMGTETVQTGDSQQGKIKEYKRENGTLEKSTTIKDGQLNGVSRLYYENGKTVMLEMNYVNNVKNGEEKKYYKTGELYRIRTYKNGRQSGKETRYYEDGKIMTELNYLNGFPGIDLKEYSKQENQLEKYPEILANSTNTVNGKRFKFRLSNKAKKVTFYLGDLKEGKFLHENLRILPEKDGVSTMDFPRNYHKDTEIVSAVYTTRKRAKCVLTKEIRIK